MQVSSANPSPRDPAMIRKVAAQLRDQESAALQRLAERDSAKRVGYSGVNVGQIQSGQLGHKLDIRA